MFSTLMPSKVSRPFMSISLSKWPMLPTMALFFICFMCSSVMMLKLPVVVTNMSIWLTTRSILTTWKPSMQACRAQIGSISLTMTRAPAPRMAKALPLPTSPKPQISARLPPIITSVARMIPSGNECRQPYTLSNLDFVTQSLTLMAGNKSSPLAAISLSRCTPVVVSSLTPLRLAAIFVHFFGFSSMESRMMLRTHLNSGLSVLSGSGFLPSFSNISSYSLPLWMSSVASPPSSTRRSGPSTPSQVRHCSVHHQYSGRVSPFHAKTAAVPAFAIPEAAWSCVLKMLQEAQRTAAPSSASVSMSTPVWMVMCREPEIRTPPKGFFLPCSLRQFMRPGISASASVSSLRPNSARPMSLTLDSPTGIFSYSGSRDSGSKSKRLSL
mmetsp:Transcript_91930/g.256088  ORF Transcript_91930/g.256088 Transcript_91930/m.256088 type:complete len:383 (-) Transcript_91930:1566-2714(-)